MREFVIILFIILASCSKEGSVSQADSFRSRAQKSGILFFHCIGGKNRWSSKCVGETPSLSYSEGCQKVIRVKVKDIDFLFVGFENAEQAKKEPKRLNQVYYHNWVIDEVRGATLLRLSLKNVWRFILSRG